MPNRRTPIDPHAPVKLAWDAYLATDNYENTRKWALYPLYAESALWAAFLEGFRSAELLHTKESIDETQSQ